MNYIEDIKIAKQCLAGLHTDWPGKETVLHLKEVDYNWRQMEWWAFYFEWLCRDALKKTFTIPGERIDRTQFDAFRSINWDFKAKAIKSDDHRAILNDQAAMDESINKYSAHGLIIGLCDVEYNDSSRTFQRWHTALKGGLSSYEIERKERTNISRYRNTHARLVEILFVIINRNAAALLSLHHQGRNSNGRETTKYMYEFEDGEILLQTDLCLARLD